jgi:Zinc knuckle
VEPPDTSYRDVQLALRFTIGLNSSYSAYKQYYEGGLKDWPQSLVDAFSEAAKFRPRTAGSGNPGDVGRANAFAMRGRGRGRGRGRNSGRGRSNDIRSGYTGSQPVAPRGDRQNTAPGRVRVTPVENQATIRLSEKRAIESTGSTSGGPSEYGTRKGACHTCGESGHYSFECKAIDSENNAKSGGSTAQSDSSGHGKGK